MSIYMVRHGAIDMGKIAAGEGKRYIGQIDLPLTRTGQEQAQKLRNRLAGVKLTGIYCSDLSRSLMTAEIIAQPQHIAPVADAGLREISLGAWEGRSFKEIRLNYPTEFARRGKDVAGFVPPGGESFAGFSKRIMASFMRIVDHAGGDLLFVGHAGANRVIISNLIGIPLNNIFQICQDYACLNILEPNFRQDHKKYRLKLLNCTKHLGA